MLEIVVLRLLAFGCWEVAGTGIGFQPVLLFGCIRGASMQSCLM